MDRGEDGPAGYEDQGTRVGAPDQTRMEPGQHSDSPPARPERTTGAGAEATAATPKTSGGHEGEHRSGYGGGGGAPVTDSDSRA